MMAITAYSAADLRPVSSLNEVLLLALARERAAGNAQWRIAAQAGVNPTLLSLWVHGHRIPRPEEAARVAKVLGLSVTELFPMLGTEDSDAPVHEAGATQKAGDADAHATG